jgi:glyceraldehyde 3-phosphate dehydrogenase
MRVAINGFGRIGRNVFKIIEQRPNIDVVAINDLSDPERLAQLLKRDSVFGEFEGEVRSLDGAIQVNGREIEILSKKDPADLPWDQEGIDFAVESTGVFRHREDLQKHVEAGAEKVLLTVPPKDEIDAMVVLGVNEDSLSADDTIISNASCTTNCLATMCKVAHDAFGIEEGLMTTVHGYTNSQNLLDQIHSKPRRARAAAENIIPTTTGAAKAIGDVIPELDGKLDGMAMRVPVPDGSITDLVCRLSETPSIDEINNAYKEAANGELQGIVGYTEEPLVSRDIIGNPHSSVFDADLTQKIGDDFVKLLGWYDNEWGYSNRVVDLMALAWQKAN